MMQIDRVPTGIKGLDQLIEGGFPKGRSILVTGEPGTGKTIFCLQFLAEGLARGEKGIYVAADEDPIDILEQATSLGWDFEKHIAKKELAILNAATYLSSPPGAGKDKHVDLHQAIGDLGGFAGQLNATRLVLDPAGIAIATAAGSQVEPQIAFDGNNYFIVWADVDSLFLVPPVSNIYGRRIMPDGTLLDGSADTDGIEISTSALSKGDITVHFNGTEYLVVWRMGAYSNDPPAGVFASRITTAGVKLDGTPDSTGLAVTGPPIDYSIYVHPVLLSNGTNTLLTWNNNIELSGTRKSLEALFIYPF